MKPGSAKKGSKIMTKLKNSLVAFAGLMGLLGLITLVTPATGQGQGDGNQHPLNVNVVNTASGPALVRDVDVPMRNPVQIQVNSFIGFGETSNFATVYTVPAGARLVIEHVALVSDTLQTGNAVRGTIGTDFGGNSFSHPLDVRAQAPVNTTLFVVNHPMLGFADPGTDITLTTTVDQPQGDPSVGGGYSALRGVLSGYLESVP